MLLTEVGIRVFSNGLSFIGECREAPIKDPVQLSNRFCFRVEDEFTQRFAESTISAYPRINS